jgi:hypothetical protein
VPRISMFDQYAAERLNKKGTYLTYRPGHGYEEMPISDMPAEGLIFYPPFCEEKDTKGSM